MSEGGTSESLAVRVLAEARDWEKSAMLRSGNGEQSALLPFLRAVKELAIEVIRQHDKPDERPS